MAIGAAASLILSLVSSWINVALYTLELTLCRRYFLRPSRPLVHRIGVWLLLFFDTICTLAICINVSLSVLDVKTTNYRLILAPISVVIMTTYASASIAQMFLCNLFYVLTGKRIISALLLILILIHFGFTSAAAILALTREILGGIVLTTTTVGAIACAATDVAIASTLVLKFWTMLPAAPPEHASRSLINRTLILTVASGAVVATNTVIMMILLLKGNPVFDFFYTTQGRLYSLTILGNFLVGVPTRNGQETMPSQRRGTSLSALSAGIFHVGITSHAASPQTRRSTVAPGPSKTTSAPSLPFKLNLHESLHLGDLALGSFHSKPSPIDASSEDADDN
ncbi:hypothetical protein B0H11DRAFT_2268910 [Mycena galericulata]|nr:hypothetical protein B0H11DRAFT_2268910 [Mycena galericulata]